MPIAQTCLAPPPRRGHRPLLLALVALCLPSASFAEYRLGSGDVIELHVPSAPDLRQKATVDVDGDVAFPLVGPIKVAGRLLSEVRSDLRALLPKKSLRQTGADGRENEFFIEPDDVTLNITDYRPIYLTGDVAKPGEQAYRPAMTVRQALSVAGGLDPMRQRIGSGDVDLTVVRSDYESLWAQVVREQVRVLRLEAELAGKSSLEPRAASGKDAATDRAVMKRESELLETREADRKNEKTYLNSAVRQTQTRLSALSEQQKKEDEGVKLDTADLDRVQGLFEKGQGTITRVMDARRALLLSSTRQLQTFAQVGQVELQRDELGRRLQKVDDARRAEILDELQTASVKLTSLRSQLHGVTEKLLLAGPVLSAVAGVGKLAVVVYRRGSTGEDVVTATQETALLPGDVVEIAIDGFDERRAALPE